MSYLQVAGPEGDREIVVKDDSALGGLVRELTIRFARGDLGAWVSVPTPEGGSTLEWVSAAHRISAHFDSATPPAWVRISVSAIETDDDSFPDQIA